MQKKRDYMPLFIGLLIAICCLFIFKEIIFGNYLFIFKDYNDDTYQTYFTIYNMVVNQLHQGNFSLFNFTSAFGSNILSMQSAAFDPFAILIYIIAFFSGTQAIAPLLIVMHILKIVLAGVICYYFLNFFNISRYSKCIGAIAFAFNAFLIGSIGQHYFFATAPVVLIALLYCIERFIKKRDYSVLFVVLVALITVLWSVYLSFVFLAFAGMYVFFRYFFYYKKYSIKSFLKWILPFYGAFILALVMGMIIFIPEVYQIISVSERTTKELAFSPFGMMDLEVLRITFLRFFSENAQAISANWKGSVSFFNAAHLFTSILFIVALPQYIYYKIKNIKRDKRNILVLLIGLIIVFSLTNYFVGALFSLFVDHTFRFTFIFFPLFILVLCKYTDECIKDGLFSIPIALLTIVISTVAMGFTNLTHNFMPLFIIGVLILCSILYFLLSKDIKPKYIKIILLIVLVLSVSYEARVTTFKKRALLQDVNLTATENVIDAINGNDHNFYRFDINDEGYRTYQTFNYGMIGEFRSVSYYNSVLNKNINIFRRDVLDNLDHNLAGSYNRGSIGKPFRNVTADLFGLKYVYSDFKTNNPHWELLGTYDGKLLYKNHNLDSIGLEYKQYITEKEFYSLSSLEQRLILPFAVIIPDNSTPSEEMMKASKIDIQTHDLVYNQSLRTTNLDLLTPSLKEKAIQDNSLRERNFQDSKLTQPGEKDVVELSLDNKEINNDNQQNFLRIKLKSDKPNNIEISYDAGDTRNFWLSDNLTISDSISDADLLIQASNSINDEMEYVLELPLDTTKIVISSYQNSPYQLISLERISTDGINYNYVEGDLKNEGFSNTVEGTISNFEGGLFVLPIIYEEGWDLFVDGQKQDIIRTDLAFSGAYLSKGNHEIKMVYQTPKLQLGLVITVIGSVVFIGIVVILIRKYSKNKNN